MDELVVNNIFTSIQGEGLWTGMPMTFLRLQGCNLRCVFCDTKEAIATQGGSRHDPMELAELLIDTASPRVVCVTGGEPVLQITPLLAMCNHLHVHGFRVHLETNGTVPMSRDQCKPFTWITVSPKPPLFDCKVPMECVDEFKFVMGASTDIGREYPGVGTILAYLGSVKEHVPIWLQPENNRPEAIQWCLSMINEEAGPHMQLGLSVQMHKLIDIE